LGNVVGYDDNDLLLCEDEVDSKVKRWDFGWREDILSQSGD
jgi:hypothetical protein